MSIVASAALAATNDAQPITTNDMNNEPIMNPRRSALATASEVVVAAAVDPAFEGLGGTV